MPADFVHAQAGLLEGLEDAHDGQADARPDPKQDYGPWKIYGAAEIWKGYPSCSMSIVRRTCRSRSSEMKLLQIESRIVLYNLDVNIRGSLL